MRNIVLFMVAAGVSFGQTVPRPEYPEPQFERAQWQNLNGPWEFEFDDEGAGLKGHWEAPSHKLGKTITVPFCFESKLSGIGDTSFHGVVWYRRALNIPPAWSGKRMRLHFGAVDYRARVWVNGQLAGTHEGGNVPFALDITNVLKAAGNVVTVRAEDPPTDRYIPRGKQYWEPKSRSIFYTRTTGIWQTVWLEPVSNSYLQTVKMMPTSEGIATLYAHVHAPTPELMLRTTIRLEGKTEAVSTVRAADSHVSGSIAVNSPRLWSPATPNLYDVTFELLEGDQVVDQVKSYTGFRTVSTENGRFLLNGRPLYLKMVLDQGYWPESTLTPPTDEAIQYDIRMTKEMGFNGARKHQKLEDPRYLYWADKLGLLVSSEMANAYLFDDLAVERFTAEWMSAVSRDFNHPSIVMWVPINESWGVPNVRDPRQTNYLKQLYSLTHAFDSSRPVIDNDGWEHTDSTDLFALHDYARSGELLVAKYKDVTNKPGSAIPANSRQAMAPGFHYNGTPLLLSEFGGIAYIPAGTQVPAESWGYSGVEKSEQDALERLRGLYVGIAKIPAFAGICYTQLTDVEQEVNGLLTYDRKPKFPSATLQEINSLIGR